MQIRSEAFEANKSIPKRHTADGEDLSPVLSWSNLPAGTKELALIVDDPDAPTAEPWVHWVIYKISPSVMGLAEGVADDAVLADPKGAVQGKNSSNTAGYRGPAPPRGHGVHHYHFKLYALNAAVPVGPGLEKAALLKAMEGHVLAQAEVVGLYQR